MSSICDIHTPSSNAPSTPSAPLIQPAKLQDSPMMSQESHSSSTSSSLSPSSLVTSQDSNHAPPNTNSGCGSVPLASQESIVSGPPSQASMID